MVERACSRRPCFVSEAYLAERSKPALVVILIRKFEAQVGVGGLLVVLFAWPFAAISTVAI